MITGFNSGLLVLSILNRDRQSTSHSWETAGKAYLEGYKHWRDLPADTNDIEYIMREAAYEMLLENPDSIYNTADFKYDLKMKREE